MLDEARLLAREEAAAPRRALTVRPIAQGPGWAVGEFVCGFGPADRPFEERYDCVTIAAVLEGSFRHRSESGTALLHPGAFLLGNADECYVCGHEHGTGDRCIAFRFAPALFEEIAASAAGSHRFRFPAAMLPGMPALARPLVEIEARTRAARARVQTPALPAREPVAMEEFALGLAERVAAAVSGFRGSRAAPSARDERRIGTALRFIEAHAEEPLDLDRLAAVAGMSKYHFLRTFRRAVGATPYQYLLGFRMRRAAVSLATTPAPVAAIAFDAGFGDLSTFNHRFRALFGASPTAFRRERGQSGAALAS